jgi:hypothetical protein
VQRVIDKNNMRAAISGAQNTRLQLLAHDIAQPFFSQMLVNLQPKGGKVPL